jgi:putative hydrolase of the HAD superfamily
MRAVLFDLGHTLINYHNDWSGPERRAVEAVAGMVRRASADGVEAGRVAGYLSELLQQGKRVKATDNLEVPLEDILDRCFHRFSVAEDEELMGGALEAFYAVILERRTLVPRTLEMLQSVRDLDFQIGLVSDVAWGLPSYFPMRDMQHFGLDQYFDDMVFSTDVGLRKPNPKIFKIALSNVGAEANRSFFVGNNLQADIAGAKGVGMTAVLKESDYYTHDDRIVPDARISDWQQLEDLLRQA